MSPQQSMRLLDNILGHEVVLAELVQLIKRKAVPHAMLFAGPAGVGKKTMARAFAAMLLENEAEPGEANRLVDLGAHPDFHIVTREGGKKDLPVDAIRSLCSALQLKPYYGQSSVAVIDNAHEMNIAASNSLLTTLEEPNSGNYIILVTDSPQRLPETIVSRCQIFHFSTLSEAQVAALIKNSFASSVDAALLEHIAESLQGNSLAPLQLETLLDPRTLLPFDAKQLVSHFKQLVEEREKVRSRLKILFSSDTYITAGDAVALASDLASDKEAIPLVWELLSEGIRGRMRSAVPAKSTGWSDLLLELIEFQKLTHERSLNPQLQFASICMKIAACQ